MALFRRKREEKPLDLDERSPTTGLKHKDLLVLHQLMQAGADLKQPRHTVHYLYFASPEAATAASHEAEARGFEVEVRDPLPAYPGAVVARVRPARCGRRPSHGAGPRRPLRRARGAARRGVRRLGSLGLSAS
jgi:hypothetical protein